MTRARDNCHFQGAAVLAKSLKVVNEHLTSLDLGFNEIRVSISHVYIMV